VIGVVGQTRSLNLEMAKILPLNLSRAG
jgi:hypothetical protein